MANTQSPTFIFFVDDQLRVKVCVSEELRAAIGIVDQLIHPVLLRFNPSYHKDTCVFELAVELTLFFVPAGLTVANFVTTPYVPFSKEMPVFSLTRFAEQSLRNPNLGKD